MIQAYKAGFWLGLPVFSNPSFKEIIGFIRDAAIVYFIGERIADNKR